MRLTDVDMLLKKMRERAENEYLDGRDYRDMVDFAPTINAIPIDVLEEWAVEYECNLTYMKMAIDKILDRWRKENENN